jgi:hypothetical protein
VSSMLSVKALTKAPLIPETTPVAVTVSVGGEAMFVGAEYASTAAMIAPALIASDPAEPFHRLTKRFAICSPILSSAAIKKVA